MSQFPKPSTIFIGVGTDWDAAEVIVKDMLSYVISLNGCCSSKAIQGVLNQVNPILNAMSYDSAADLDNTIRWQEDVEASYRLIYSIT